MDPIITENNNRNEDQPQAEPQIVTAADVFEHSSGQAYNEKDQELIRQLMQSRLEQGDSMEYLDLNEFEVPHPAHFAQLSKPSVSIKYPHMSFSMSCIRMFQGFYHVLPALAKNAPRIAFVPLMEEEVASLQWARDKEGRMVNKTISAPGFLDDVFYRMKWSKRIRFKAYGRLVNTKKGLALAFDLDGSAWIPGTFREFVDKATGEVKKRKEIFLPEQYKNKAGMDFSDYESSRQMDLFTDFPDLMSKTYDDIPEEYLQDVVSVEDL